MGPSRGPNVSTLKRGRAYFLEDFREIEAYFPEVFREIEAYSPDVFWEIVAHFSEVIKMAVVQKTHMRQPT